jgi:hypothetical protein
VLTREELSLYIQARVTQVDPGAVNRVSDFVRGVPALHFMEDTESQSVDLLLTVADGWEISVRTTSIGTQGHLTQEAAEFRSGLLRGMLQGEEMPENHITMESDSLSFLLYSRGLTLTQLVI